MKSVNPNAVWRDSGREAKLGPLNARAVIPIVFFLFNVAWWTLAVVLLTIAVLVILDYYGLTPEMTLRIIRSKLAGPRISVRQWWA